MAKEKKKANEEEEKNLLKNYIILVVILLLVVGLTIYLCECFKVYNEEQKTIPVIRGTLISEITEVDLEPFLIENPSTIIYACTSSSDKCRSFEKDFKKVINKYGLQDTIVYLNLSNVVDQKAFVDEFNSKHEYKKGKLTTNYPVVIYFEEGKVKNILQGKKDEKLKIKKVKDFIELNKVGE